MSHVTDPEEGAVVANPGRLSAQPLTVGASTSSPLAWGTRCVERDGDFSSRARCQRLLKSAVRKWKARQ